MPREELRGLLLRLAADEAAIGKVPCDVDAGFEAWASGARVSWVELREALNCWRWRLTDREQLDA